MAFVDALLVCALFHPFSWNQEKLEWITFIKVFICSFVCDAWIQSPNNFFCSSPSNYLCVFPYCRQLMKVGYCSRIPYVDDILDVSKKGQVDNCTQYVHLWTQNCTNSSNCQWISLHQISLTIKSSTRHEPGQAGVRGIYHEHDLHAFFYH